MENQDKEQHQIISKKKNSGTKEIVESIVIAVVLAVVIRLFILEPFYIPSGSMEPTLLINDRIIVSKITYDFTAPKPGDIIVFHYPLDPSRNFVKRLIAVGGDTVEIKNNHVLVNGKAIQESYLPPDVANGTHPMGDYALHKVPAGEYFMMGDNRNNSDDSRVWGYVKRDLIIGKAEVIYWPLNRIEIAR